MDTQDVRKRLVRTSVLIPEETDAALREMAELGNRPLSREIRTALEEHVARSHQTRNGHDRRATGRQLA